MRFFLCGIALSLLAGTATADNGPRLSDAAFFESLNLDKPELAAVQAAVAEGNYETARESLVLHLKTRSEPKWFFDWRLQDPDHVPKFGALDDLAGFGRRVADATLDHRYSFVGITHEFEDDIDWSYNPTEQRDSEHARNLEWPWQLNRHREWVALGYAYWETRDEKYAQEFVRQLTDWIARNPVPQGDEPVQGPGSSWRTIEAGVRMSETWPWAYHFFLSSPHFTEDAIIAMLKSVAEHAGYLMAHPTDYNWLALEMKGLYFAGAVFPEFEDAPTWRRFAADRMRVEQDVQFYPDGAQTELSPSIHYRVLGHFSDIYDIARINDYPLPEGYVPRLEDFYNYLLGLMKPDRDVPQFQDCWNISVPKALEQGYQYFPERKDFLWVASGGKTGTAPSETHVIFPWAGYAMLRSDWSEQAHYCAFDFGVYGGKHQHEDKLNFVLSAYGRDLVVEAGSYAFEKSKWRHYTLSSAGHNVMLVDGKEQRRRIYIEQWNAEAPMPHRFETAPHPFVEASYGEREEEVYGFGDKPAVHTRRIYFITPSEANPFWLVVDKLAPNDEKEHRYESIFHLNAPMAELRETKAILTQHESGPNIGVYPVAVEGLDARIIQGQEEPEVQGWLPHGHGVPGMDPIPTASYRLEGAGPKTFAYAFYPVAEGSPPDLRLEQDEGLWQVSVNGQSIASVHVE